MERARRHQRLLARTRSGPAGTGSGARRSQPDAPTRLRPPCRDAELFRRRVLPDAARGREGRHRTDARPARVAVRRRRAGPLLAADRTLALPRRPLRALARGCGSLSFVTRRSSISCRWTRRESRPDGGRCSRPGCTPPRCRSSRCFPSSSRSSIAQSSAGSSDYESYAFADSQRAARGAGPLPVPRETRVALASPRLLFGLAFESRPPPAPA